MLLRQRLPLLLFVFAQAHQSSIVQANEALTSDLNISDQSNEVDAKEISDNISNLDPLIPTGSEVKDSKVDEFPVLKFHTKERVTAPKGYRIEYSVALDNQPHDVFFRWIKDRKTFCSNQKCEIDTRSWDLGFHTFTAVAYNQYGSSAVTFFLTLEEGSVTTTGLRSVPELQQASPDVKQSLANPDSHYIFASRGIGYVNRPGYARVLGTVKQPLNWVELIRSHAKGLVELGLDKFYRVLLLPRSEVKLSTVGGLKNIHLRKGGIRFNSFDPKTPAMEVILSDKAYILTDAQTDMIVQKQSDNFRVDLLEGTIIIFTENKKGISFRGPTQIEVRGFNIKIPTKLPTISYDFLEQTSPGIHLEKTSVYPYRQKFNKTQPEVASSLENLQPVLALHQLAQIEVKLRDKDYFILRYRALRDLGMLTEAHKMIERASNFAPYQEEMQFLVGRSLLELNKASEADKIFRVFNYSPGSYEMGVACYKTKDYVCAEFYLRRAMKADNSKEKRDSSAAFLSTDPLLPARKIELGFNIGYDSNPYKINADDLIYGIAPEGSPYLDTMLQLGAYTPKSRSARIGIEYDFSRRSHVGLQSKEISLMDQKIKIPTLINIGVQEVDPLISLELTPTLHLVHHADNRMVDGLGASFSFGLPRLILMPNVSYQQMRYTDPLPVSADRMSVHTGRIDSAHDQSARESILGLTLKSESYKGWHLGLEGEKRDIQYTDDLLTSKGFTDNNIRVKFALASLSLDQEMGIAQLTRRSKALNDPETSLDLFYKMRYYASSSYSLNFGIDYRSHKGNNEFTSYKSINPKFGMNVRF